LSRKKPKSLFYLPFFISNYLSESIASNGKLFFRFDNELLLKSNFLNPVENQKQAAENAQTKNGAD